MKLNIVPIGNALAKTPARGCVRGTADGWHGSLRCRIRRS